MAKGKDSLTRVLLMSGVLSGILFIGVSLILSFVVPGFDITRQPISVLLLGNFGWIQMVNFELSGALALLFAVGMWRLLHPGKGGTWGPILVGLYGLGIVIAGLFYPDPEFGFPPGAPLGEPTAMSMHGSIHGFAFFGLVLAIIAVSIVFARRFASIKQKGWKTYCIATAIGAPFLLILGIILSGATGRGALPLLGVGVVTSAWISLIANHLLKSPQQN